MAIVQPPYKKTPEGGDYSVTMATGALTIVAAAGPIWSCQWTSTALIAVVKRISIDWVVTTAYGTAQGTHWGIYFARSYTVVDSGGTAATLTTTNGRMDTKYPTTSLTDLRIGTTGAITAGTRTLDTQPIDTAVAGTNALGASGNIEHFFGDTDSRQQIILRQNEGLVISNLVTMGATGVLKLYISMEWAEVPLASVR